MKSSLGTPATHTAAFVLVALGMLLHTSCGPSPGANSPEAEINAEWIWQSKVQVHTARLFKWFHSRQLKSEKDPDKLQDIIISLGDSAHEGVVIPLVRVVDDTSKDTTCRQIALDSLYRIATNRERTAHATDAVLQHAVPSAKKQLQSSEARLRESAAYFLYIVGEKDASSQVLLEALRSGQHRFLNTFIFYKKIGPIMVNSALVGDTKKVDPDAKPIVIAASGPEFPEEVRFHAARLLLRLEETGPALKALEDIIKNGKNLGLRGQSLSTVADVKNVSAKRILTAAATRTGKLQSLAHRMLIRWTKNQESPNNG